MPKLDKAAKARAKAAAAKAAKAGAKEELDIEGGGDPELTKEQLRVASKRAVTGVLASDKSNTDVKFDAFSLQVGGNQLINDTEIELNQGCRYGLIGANGSGKSNVLASIAQREVPLPDFIDVFHLHEEAPPTEHTAVEAVINHIVEEAERLQSLSDKIMEEFGPEDERIAAISERIEELDPTGTEPRARKILSGLGFADHLVPMDRKTKHMSGGWRMRVSLAKALFAAPQLLLLDEPTNHLDLEACVWLEEHLARYKKCLFMVSHSQDFLNAVCTHTVWLNNRTLKTYGGNYAQFVTTVEEEERVAKKQYEKQQADMQKLSDFVRVNRANGVAQSAKSKKKVLEKLEEDAIDKPRVRGDTLNIEFKNATRLDPPVLPFDVVSFSYSGKKEDYLYTNLDLAVDCDSRVALVGPNGCGKSTLIKLMSGELSATEGTIKRHQHMMLGQFHQHSADILNNDKSPLQFMREHFPAGTELAQSDERWRSYLNDYGFSSTQMESQIGMLSDGQKSRLVFAIMAKKPYNLLLLDEPTNHLDLDGVDGLAAAIEKFDGGIVLVSHDFRLIDKVAKQIWVCENKTVKVWDGTIHEYKKLLAKKMGVHRL
mmetsp:Transcript_102530/g.256919  ORF Transcript_102530/g.256919 Transcript_102530/m.256919 type:complete len:600 (+) Transcript_102530:86-1885(+)